MAAWRGICEESGRAGPCHLCASKGLTCRHPGRDVAGCDPRTWRVGAQKALVHSIDPWKGQVGMPTSVCPAFESWLLHNPALRPSLILTLLL